ncbi:hypothetical protein DFH07DRAFT_741558 [Mycena maculata]|uniref:Rho termination factor N-terminal domain-containing protein n=1 Tax=Mycena maculata TaxID=230809 RepID=A0AAD7J722_9AGAR|nr:hypothetical protein DFH07DRAFT_741558 [Mycena maculata]
MSTEAELKKLTVPQLKALCKERRITGYSKLGKDVIIQKLLGIAPAAPAPSSSATAPILTETATPTPINSTDIHNSSASGPAVAPSHDPSLSNPASDSSIPVSTSKSRPKKQKNPTTSAKRKTVPADVPGPSTANAVADTIPAQTISARKPSKKTRPDVPTQPTVNTATHSAPAATTSRPPPVSKRSSTTLAPADPPAPKKRKIALSPAPKQPPVSKFVLPMKAPTAITPAAPTIPSIIAQEPVRLPEMRPKIPQKRFVPLVVTRKVPVPVPTAAAPLASIPVPLLATVPMLQPLYYLDFPTAPPPKSLSMIALPPKAVQRKRVVPRLSLVLSGVAEEDLFNCVLVSRTFRYAGKFPAPMYLSAFHRLTRYFAGERLSAVLKKHSETMTDMWPYLEQRTQELCGRKRQYSSSFLGRVFPPGSSSAISDRLWTSPDHERQTVVALRFLLTRLFFQVSVGGGKEGKGWTEGQIVDAQRLVNDEVWAITVRHSATSTECFYVLESTCEPLTTTTESPETGLPVRTDWAAYIAHRMTLPTDPPPPRLLDYLSWTNHEEYLLGISRLWLKRIEGEGEIGIAKRITAERYILACVVGNSLSGRWMSSTQMAQDFAGLADLAPARVKTSPKVNLFLPKHHHVESVHFTTSGSAKRPLHPALAVIQTPDREYFILRDNGMQVGCEEEGVAAAWMDIIGCENSGVATSA